MGMGETRISLRLIGPEADAEIEMLVDTGSTLTKIPSSVARKIGIAPRYKAEVELADGRVVERDESEVVAELNDMRKTIPLLMGPDGEEPLLGLTTLEIFGLKVNPVTQKLEPAKFIEYALASRTRRFRQV
jgi:clan AA aspartic protease